MYHIKMSHLTQVMVLAHKDQGPIVCYVYILQAHKGPCPVVVFVYILIRKGEGNIENLFSSNHIS